MKWPHSLRWLIKGEVDKVVQLFWGCFCDFVFIPFESSNVDQFLFQKLYDLDDLYNFAFWITKDLIIFIVFLLLGCMNSLWNVDGFHAIWHENFISYPLQCAEQPMSPSNLAKYCACHAKWLACLILVTYETSFTMRGATGVALQPHEILRLPRRMTRMLDPRHKGNVIYIARGNQCHPPTSPNTAPATQNDHPKSDRNLVKQLKRHLQCAADPRPIRPWPDHDPRPNPSARNPPRNRAYFSRSQGAFCIQKYNISRFGDFPNFTKYSACKEKWNLNFSPSTAPATKSDTWTSPSTAPATKSDTWTSPSTAPARKSGTWASHKYCACHEKLTIPITWGFLWLDDSYCLTVRCVSYIGSFST